MDLRPALRDSLDRSILALRALALRALAQPARLAKSEGLLLPHCGGHYALYQTVRPALAEAAKRAGCSCPVASHPKINERLASKSIGLSGC